MKKIISFIIMTCITISLLSSIPAYAYNTGDDYPAKYKNYALDAVVDEWNFYNRECTSFVAWCLNSRNGINFTNYYGGSRWSHGKYWGEVAKSLGITVNKTPSVGSVAWWNTGEYGHVAWVKEVSANNITIEEYNVPAYSGNYNTRTISVASVTGFIHFKDLSPVKPSINIGDNFYAKIVNTHSQKCLTNDNDNVSIRTDSNALSQWWHFTMNNDGTYKITSMYDKKCLDVHMAGDAIRTNIKVATDNAGNAQKWIISGLQGEYVLNALCTAKVLDVEDGSTEEGSNVQTYTKNNSIAQLYTIEPHFLGTCSDIGDEFYAYIYNHGLDTYVTNKDSNVVSCSKMNSVQQIWHFSKNSDYSYTIKSLYDGRCLDVDNLGTQNNVNIKVENGNNSAAQRWYIYDCGDGYCLRAKCTQKVMDIAGGLKVDGTNIQTYSANKTVAQLFKIDKNIINVAFDANGGELEKTKARIKYDSINEERGTDQLVIYTDSKASTGTNIYGTEVLINSDNHVVDIIRGVGDATIPMNGFVLSAHNIKRYWLEENILIGDYVNFHGNTQEVWVWSKNGWLTWTKKIAIGQEYGELPVPLDREVYTFDGWYTSAIGGEKITSETIVTATSDHTLYAHWKQQTPNTSTIVNNNVFTVKCTNVENDSLIILSLYKGNKFVKLYKATYRGEDIPITVMEEHDKAKVMVWQSFSTLKPITSAEIVK